MGGLFCFLMISLAVNRPLKRDKARPHFSLFQYQNYDKKNQKEKRELKCSPFPEFQRLRLIGNFAEELDTEHNGDRKSNNTKSDR